jgi:cation diffusion facilitator family transporter
MSISKIADQRQHSHAFGTQKFAAERSTRRAVTLTAAMMVVEIVGGWNLNSMALLADGWHMSSHTLALGLSLFAYACARRFSHDPRFTFGTWKIEVLGGYTSAILLLGVAGLMLFQSAERLVAPQPIHYREAIVIAVLGLAVNLLCAWWLRDSHDHAHHGHGHHHGHDHHHDHAHADGGHDDLNLRAAYLHVVADAATSVLAIVALLAGMFWGVSWMDPAMGIVGAVLVTVWAWGLLRSTGKVLLDAEMDAPVVEEVREVIASLPHPVKISDLHVWRVGNGAYACVISLVTEAAFDADYYRQAIQIHEELVHVTVEIHQSQGSTADEATRMADLA